MRRQPRLSASKIEFTYRIPEKPGAVKRAAPGERENMKLVEVKFEIPEDLEPRVAALAAEMGLSFDLAAQLLLWDGYATHLRSSIERAERELREQLTGEVAV